MPSLKEKVGLYEIESINNTCMIVIAVSRKEYFNQFKNQDFNKKHKGVKKNATGMKPYNYTNRIFLLNDHKELLGVAAEK